MLPVGIRTQVKALGQHGLWKIMVKVNELITKNRCGVLQRRVSSVAVTGREHPQQTETAQLRATLPSKVPSGKLQTTGPSYFRPLLLSTYSLSHCLEKESSAQKC